MSDFYTEALLASAIILMASAIQTAVGFGMALVAVPILVLINPAMVPAPIVLVALVQLCLNCWAHRQHISWRPLAYAFIGRIPGTLLAIWALAATGIAGIQLFIGLAVLLAVALSLGNWQLQANDRNHFWAGAASGFTGTTSAIGGPPIALLYQREKGDRVRANLSAYFIVGSIMSFAGMSLAGVVSSHSLYYTAWFIPAAILGFWLGLKGKRFISQSFMRPAILILCGGSGTAVLWQAISALEF